MLRRCHSTVRWLMRSWSATSALPRPSLTSAATSPGLEHPTALTRRPVQHDRPVCIVATPRSLDAIFLLGRVEELRAQGAAQAIARYDEYLAQAPAGPYAAEALGRKMILIDQREGPSAARPLADEYLQRFPGGSYAGAARALQHAP